MRRHGTCEKERRSAVRAEGAVGVLGVLLVTGLAACGNLTAGGVAEVEVVVASDEGAVAEAPGPGGVGGWEPSLVPGSRPLSPLFGLEGTYQLEVAVSLLDATGGVVALTDGVQTVAGTLGPGSRVALTVQGVPPGAYGGFRATFHRVEADVSALPGAGPSSGSAQVDLAAGTVTVEREHELLLEDGERVRLILDLRVGAWLQALGTLPPGPFRNAVRFEVEAAGAS